MQFFSAHLENWQSISPLQSPLYYFSIPSSFSIWLPPPHPFAASVLYLWHTSFFLVCSFSSLYHLASSGNSLKNQNIGEIREPSCWFLPCIWSLLILKQLPPKRKNLLRVSELLFRQLFQKQQLTTPNHWRRGRKRKWREEKKEEGGQGWGKKHPRLICVQKWHSRAQIVYNGPRHFSEPSSRNRMLLLFPSSICSTDLTASNSVGSDVQLQSWVRALKWKSPFSSEIQQRSPAPHVVPRLKILWNLYTGIWLKGRTGRGVSLVLNRRHSAQRAKLTAFFTGDRRKCVYYILNLVSQYKILFVFDALCWNNGNFSFDFPVVGSELELERLILWPRSDRNPHGLPKSGNQGASKVIIQTDMHHNLIILQKSLLLYIEFQRSG